VTVHAILKAVREVANDRKHRYWPNLISLSTAREAFPSLVLMQKELTDESDSRIARKTESKFPLPSVHAPL